MTVRGSKDVPFFLIDGLDALGDLTEIQDNGIEAVIQEKNAFGNAWPTPAFTGIRQWSLVQRGFYNDAASGPLERLLAGATMPGLSHVLVYGIGGTATGAQFIGAAGAMETKFTRAFTRNELTKGEAEYAGNGPVDYGGKIVRTWKLNSATGRTTATPLDGVTSSTGGVAYLAWGAPTTAAECNIRLIHSSDNITYATLFTFAKVTGAAFSSTNIGGAERLTTTAVIERYTAYDVTTASATGGTFANNLNSFLGLQRGYSS